MLGISDGAGAVERVPEGRRLAGAGGGHQRLSGRDRGEPSDDRDPSTQLHAAGSGTQRTRRTAAVQRACIHRGPPESGSLTAPNTEQWSNAEAFSVGTASSHSPRGRVSSPGAGAKFEPDRSVRFTAARPVPVPAWLGGPAFGPARPVGGRTQMTPFKLAQRVGQIDQRAQDACSILRCVGPTRAGNPGCATSQRPGASPRASRGHKLAGQYVVPRLYPIDDVADRGGVERVE